MRIMPLPFLHRNPRRSLFAPQTAFERLLEAPVKLFVYYLYRFLLFLRGRSCLPPRSRPPIRVVCISDTHCKTPNVPDGDILIHAGDLTNNGTIAEIQAQINWLKSLPHTYKFVVCGNHDSYFDPRSRHPQDSQRPSSSSSSSSSSSEKDVEEKVLDWGQIHYLQHTSYALVLPAPFSTTLNVYGAPQIPTCGGSSFAFQYNRGTDAWTDTIPANTDILITHAPPKYHVDLVAPVALGCEWLLRECWRVQPRVHVCGHVHAGAGRDLLVWDDGQRAFEQAMAMPSRGLRDLFGPFCWYAFAKVAFCGLRGLVWKWVWRGRARETVLVNPAIVSWDGREVEGELQGLVVDL